MMSKSAVDVLTIKFRLWQERILQKYGETLRFVYIKYQPIFVKSNQRFTKFNYGVTKTIYES